MNYAIPGISRTKINDLPFVMGLIDHLNVVCGKYYFFWNKYPGTCVLRVLKVGVVYRYFSRKLTLIEIE